MDCYLTCPRGLEEITAAQIIPYCQSIQVGRGGVSFSGDLHTLYSVNYHVRTGMYALITICDIKADNNTDLYQKITDYPWFEWMAHDTPFSIRTRGESNIFPNQGLFRVVK